MSSKEANPQEENPQGMEHVVEEKPLATIEKSKPVEVVVELRDDVHYTGFQRPFHPLQVVSWVVFFFDFLTYFLVNMVSLYNHSLLLVIGCSVIYLVLSALVLCYAIRATRVDASDPLIYEQRLIEAQG